MEQDAQANNGGHRTNSGGIWRLAWRGLRVSRTMVMVLVLVVSLAANAALFVGGVLYNVIDEALESVTGLATATGKQRKASDELKRKNRQLVDRNRKLQNGMTKVRRKNGRLAGRMARLRTETNVAVKRTVARSAKAAVRAVATAPGKALPGVGTAVVVGATAWEIKDLCDTIRDMKAIQREIDPSKSHAEDEQTVCGMEVPTEEEILSLIKMAPQNAWQRSREFLTGLNPLTPELATKLKTELDQWWNKIELNRWWNKLQTVVE